MRGIIFRIIFFFLLSFPYLAKSQNTVIVSGFVEELGTREKIKSVTIFSKERNVSVLSNDFGYFSIKAKRNDSSSIIFSHSSFETIELKVAALKDTFFTVSLSPMVKELSEIEIKEGKQNDAKSYLGTVSVPIKMLTKVPSLFGEKDIVKAVQLLPGVQSTNEGTTGYYVRGGGADQNLILVDGVTIYNVSHLFGFFSLFPAEAVKSVDLIKGGFPARYGGRLSSVLDVKLKDGNKQKVNASYSMGLLSSRISIEGPVKKGKSSFFVSGRRTYFDFITTPFFKKGNKSIYNFYDCIAKLNFNLSEKSSLTISSYFGRDKYEAIVTENIYANGSVLKSVSGSGMNWGNVTSLIKWNYAVNSKINLNQSINYTKYNNINGFKDVITDSDGNIDPLKGSAFKFTTAISDISYKSELDYFHSEKMKVKSGIGYTHHYFTPSVAFIKSNNNGVPLFQNKTSGNLNTNEVWLFCETDFSIKKFIQVSLGIHNSYYSTKQQMYFSSQPRINSKLILNENSNLQFSFSFASQPIHLLTNNGAGLPVDLWVPATKRVPPEKAIQYSAGYFIKLSPSIEFSMDAYFKKMSGIVEYAEGANFLSSAGDWEQYTERGKGIAYGTELFLYKKSGMLSGWVGYTLSWTKRQFENLNGGKWFWYKYDHRHDLKIVLMYEPSKKFDCAFNFVLYSGNKATVPDIVYSGIQANMPPVYAGFIFDVNSQYALNASSRNNFNYKTYHRADVSFNFNKLKKRGIRTWNISIYNVYSRSNPFFYSLKESSTASIKLIQFSLFPILPSISYQFKLK